MPLPTPTGEQSDVLFLPADENVVVLGSAGSGKTTLAILRAARLAHPDTANFGPTLLVTFNVTLVVYLRHWMNPAQSDFEVCNYHRFARGILNSLGENMDDAIVDGESRDNLISAAVGKTKQSLGAPILNRNIGFFIEEFRWLAQNGISTEKDYLSTERVGRTDSRLRRQDRPVVFSAYQEYLKLREAGGFRYDWDDLASGVRRALKSPPSDFKRRYKHIVVDEGQDFSPEMLRSLAESLLPSGTISFFGDVAQQIYGHRVSWKSAGIASPVLHEFTTNYRNTRQIAALALALSSLDTFGHSSDELVAPKSPTADGPSPSRIKCRHTEEELSFVIGNAKKLGASQSVAILGRSRSSDRTLGSLLSSGTRLRRDMRRWVSGPGVYYGTLHAAKGLEFDTVFMIGCGQTDIEQDHWYEDLDEDEASSIISKLLYVGITRAKRNLILTYTGQFTPLLPQDPALYAK